MVQVLREGTDECGLAQSGKASWRSWTEAELYLLERTWRDETEDVLTEPRVAPLKV